MKRMVTIQTRIPLSFELKAYLTEYIVFYNRVQRRVFQDFRHGIPNEMGMSKYITYICNVYGMLKRSVNSIRYNVQGRMRAYQELKKTELHQLEWKVQSVQKKVNKLESEVNVKKSLVACNLLDEAGLQKYRRQKQSLYHQKNRLNRLRQCVQVLQKQIKDKTVFLCFGTKKLFNVQNRLSENSYKSHEKWLHDFQKRRDSGIFFLGESDKCCGNQLLQLQACGDEFQMKLLKDRPFRDSTKHIIISSIRFSYMNDELTYAIQNHQPVTYRILRKNRKWYLQAMFSVETDVCTDSEQGVIGIDYNDGFMEVVETNESGNMVNGMHMSLDYHGTGDRAESEIKEKLSKIVRNARDKEKDIVVENLDFRKKKSKQRKGERKGYNRMLHLFDYHRYLFWLENLCMKYGVKLVKVNPA